MVSFGGYQVEGLEQEIGEVNTQKAEQVTNDWNKHFSLKKKKKIEDQSCEQLCPWHILVRILLFAWEVKWSDLNNRRIQGTVPSADWQTLTQLPAPG